MNNPTLLLFVFAFFVNWCEGRKNATSYEGKDGFAVKSDGQTIPGFRTVRVDLNEDVLQRLEFYYEGRQISLNEIPQIAKNAGLFTERVRDRYSHLPARRDPFAHDPVRGESSESRIFVDGATYVFTISPEMEGVSFWAGRSSSTSAREIDFVVKVNGRDLSESDEDMVFDREVVFDLIGRPIRERRVMQQ